MKSEIVIRAMLAFIERQEQHIREGTKATAYSLMEAALNVYEAELRHGVIPAAEMILKAVEDYHNEGYLLVGLMGAKKKLADAIKEFKDAN